MKLRVQQSAGLAMALAIGTAVLIGYLHSPAVDAQNPDAQPARGRNLEGFMKDYQNGNFRDAYVGLRATCLDKESSSQAVMQALPLAIQCLNRLGRVAELDALLEDTVSAHNQNWRVLAAVAGHYRRAPHQGFIIAGEFERGPHRGGGQYADATERDRIRALQLLQQAQPLAEQDDRKVDVGRFFLEVADQLTSSRGNDSGWQLQVLSDLTQLPDYGTGQYAWQPWGRRARVGAPVNDKGEPVYHRVPESWQAATSDGERWRWALAQAYEVWPTSLNETLWRRAQFCAGQFGVQTIQEFGQIFDRAELDQDEPATGTFALHTLEPTETIARLATGIRRFSLPDEFNPIKLYEQIAAEPATGHGSDALDALAQIFENRRQYPRAAETWRQVIADYGDGGWRDDRLQQIVGNWCQFETAQPQAGENGATVSFKFRNADSVRFTARQIKVEELLQDVKSYLRKRPDNFDWNRMNVEQLGWRLVHQQEEKYVGQEVAHWEVKLDPRDAHFDRRITVTTPLRNAGAYLLTAELADGNTSQIVLWVNDTVIVQNSLSNNLMYYVTDAVTGRPVERANVEFFGYRQLRNNRGRPQFEFRNFAERTDANGIVIPDSKDFDRNLQFLVIARTREGRLAYLGFRGVWTAQYGLPDYQQTKAFCITDRPVYRPGQKVKFKYWIRHVDYGAEGSKFAHQDFSVELYDPQGERVKSFTLRTDAYGGMNSEWELPADAKLGAYSLRLLGQHASFRVEEYKKPEYEVTIEAPDEPVMLGEKVTATVRAQYYFGSPVTDATVKIKIMRSSYDQRWYPVAPWDWCYGPGYWWFGYDCDWYPGWRNWAGCLRPYPIWWPSQPDPPELVSEQEVSVGPDGTVDVEIDTELAKAIHGNQDHQYTITAEVRDASRRTIVGTGQVLVAREPFRVFTWVDRGYYEIGKPIQASFQAQTLDRQPVSGEGHVTLYRITYDEARQPIETPVQEWDVAIDDEGRARLKLQASQQGQYRLACSVADGSGHRKEGGYLFTVIGAGFDGSEFRFNSLELIPDQQDYRPGEQVKLQINSDHADATLLLFVRPVNGSYLPPQVIRMQGKSTVVPISVTKSDMPNFFVEAVTVFDGQVHREAKEIVVPPEKRVLQVSVEPSATEYRPGESATVQLHLTDHTGENFVGTTVVAIYDKAVEYISGGSNVPDIKEFFWKWRRHHHPHGSSNLERYEGNLVPKDEKPMQPLGVFGHTVADEQQLGDRGVAKTRMRGARQPMGMMAAASMDSADEYSMALPSEAVAEGEAVGGGGAATELVEPTVRSNFADTALWAGALETDAEGRASVSLDMPENLTTWKVKVWGLGKDTRVGSAETEVVTRKNLILRLQSPRFAVQDDQLHLSANVHNYLEQDKEVTVAIELPGDEIELLDDERVTVRIPADGEERVDWRVRIVREGMATIRMLALTDEESDAMEVQLPLQVRGMLKTESWAGTVRPQDERASLTVNVPAERRPEQSRLEIRYSPTLAAAMVDALPYLADYPYGCTEQTLNRFLPAAITQQTLLRMGVRLEDLQQPRTNLNAQELGDPSERAAQWQRFGRGPVFDGDELARMVRDGVNRLTEMQLSDGGWGWFSGWREHSYPHTTAVVVRGLRVAEQNDVAAVPAVLDRGTAWLKKYQAEQIQLLKNYRLETKPAKQSADNLDALIYLTLVEGGHDDVPMRQFLDRDRTNLSVYGLALFGLALEQVDDQPRLAAVLRNVEQYLIQDAENETAYLQAPGGGYWWYWYGDEIEANAAYLKLLSRTDPKGAVAPRLVKYLLNNRKHATYWKSTRDTAFCVEAFADFLRASGESQPDMVIEVWVDGERRQEVAVDRENLFSFDNRFVLEGEALTDGQHTIELRRRGSGPVYFNAYLTNFTLEDPITKAGLEVKVQRKFYRLLPAEKKVAVPGQRGQAVKQNVEKFSRVPLESLASVPSGSLVEVELIIESKNDYEYLMFEDRKAAGFEAVEVRSGYTANGLGAYTEYRDDRVTFFVRQLARGRHSISYRLRAETPGRFSALPAIAAAMYAPELKGNSDEFKLRVEE